MYSQEGCEPPIWTSSDGRIYRQLVGFPVEHADTYVQVVLRPVDGWPWRLLGFWSWDVDGGLRTQAAAWTSHDVDTWSTMPLPGLDVGGQILQSAAHEPGRDIAVGLGRDNSASLTWISTDGVRWRIADRSSPPIESIAAGPAGTLGLIGIWDGAGNAVTGFEVWKLIEEP